MKNNMAIPAKMMDAQISQDFIPFPLFIVFNICFLVVGIKYCWLIVSQSQQLSILEDA